MVRFVLRRGPFCPETWSVLSGPFCPWSVLSEYPLFMQEVDGSIPFRGTYLNDFSDQTDQDIRTQCALSWKWRSVNAVSLNVGSGIRLIKPVKVYMCTQTHYKHDEDGHTAPGVCGRGSVPLSHSGLTGINLIS